MLPRPHFAVGSTVETRRGKHGKRLCAPLRRSEGLHLPIPSKGAKCDSRRLKSFRLARQPSPHTAHNPLIFNAQRHPYPQITKNTKNSFPIPSFCSAGAPPFPRRRPPCGAPPNKTSHRRPTARPTRSTTPRRGEETSRLSHQSPLLFVRNAQPSTTPPHADDTTRAAAHPLQSIVISCLHPSPSYLPP